jgi:hypothetical protein
MKVLLVPLMLFCAGLLMSFAWIGPDSEPASSGPVHRLRSSHLAAGTGGGSKGILDRWEPHERCDQYFYRDGAGCLARTFPMSRALVSRGRGTENPINLCREVKLQHRMIFCLWFNRANVRRRIRFRVAIGSSDWSESGGQLRIIERFSLDGSCEFPTIDGRDKSLIGKRRTIRRTGSCQLGRRSSNTSNVLRAQRAGSEPARALDSRESWGVGCLQEKYERVRL